MGESGPAESKLKVFARHGVPFLPVRTRKGIVIKPWRHRLEKPKLFTMTTPTVNNSNNPDLISPIGVRVTIK